MKLNFFKRMMSSPSVEAVENNGGGHTLPIVKVSSVSRDDIRRMAVGEVKGFALPNRKAINAARVQFSMLKRLDGMDFARIASDDPNTLIFKRTK